MKEREMLSPEKENAITVARQQASELNVTDVESAINKIVQEAIQQKQELIKQAKARELVLSKEIAGVLS